MLPSKKCLATFVVRTSQIALPPKCMRLPKILPYWHGHQSLPLTPRARTFHRINVLMPLNHAPGFASEQVGRPDDGRAVADGGLDANWCVCNLSNSDARFAHHVKNLDHYHYSSPGSVDRDPCLRRSSLSLLTKVVSMRLAGTCAERPEVPHKVWFRCGSA